MAKKKTLQPTFKGYSCKTAGCGGHKAGYSYAASGGAQPSMYSRSFNEGMDAYQAKATAPTRVRANNNKKKTVSIGAAALGGLAAGIASSTNNGNNGGNTP